MFFKSKSLLAALMAHQLGPGLGGGAAGRIAPYHGLLYTNHALSFVPALVEADLATERKTDMQSRAPTRRKTIWGWALYDSGNSAFFTVIVTFVYAAF